MPDRSAEEASIAPQRPLSGSVTEDVVRPVSPDEPRPTKRDKGSSKEKAERPEEPVTTAVVLADHRPIRRARLRLVQVDPWSVMKTAFLLSVAAGIVTVVAVGVVWGVLGAAGLWDSVNSMVRDTLGDSTGSPFDIQQYLGTSRVLGFTMLVAVADVVLITAIATLAAFLYNLTATLVGGVEVTLAEEK